MKTMSTYCARCGRPTDGACVPCGNGAEFDRDDVYIWEDRSRFCARCGERLEGPHTCVRQTIRFYSVTDDHGEFSNFAEWPIRLGGRSWPTSEHYFQAQKYVGTPHAECIRRASTPSLAARLGRDRRQPLRPDWQAVRVEVMREALYAKFTQHAVLKALLLGTGNARLIEHTERDRFWGDGGDGRGRNMLGRLLMALRDALRVDLD